MRIPEALCGRYIYETAQEPEASTDMILTGIGRWSRGDEHLSERIRIWNKQLRLSFVP